MEIVFWIIAVIAGVGTTYTISRMVSTHQELMSTYKTDEMILGLHLFLTFVLIFTYAVTLFALNNTFWHLSYL